MATQLTSTAKYGSVSQSGNSFTISTQSGYGGYGSVSQGTLEAASIGKLSGVASGSDVSYNFLDKLAKTSYGSNINATQGSAISSTWALAAGESIYFTVKGEAKDYYNDFAYASVKYVGPTGGSYSVPSYFESQTFDSVAVKIDKDFDWGTQEVVGFTASVAGNYNFSIGVVDAFDTAVKSTITVSNGVTTKPSGTVNSLDLYSLKWVPGTASSGFSFGSTSSGMSVSDLTNTIDGVSKAYAQGGTGAWDNGNAYYQNTNGWNKGGISFSAEGVTISTANANAKDYQIEEFLGLADGALDKAALQKNSTWGSSSAFFSNATAGSAYKQLVEISGVGATVSFDYLWDGGDYLPYSDFAGVSVGGKLVTNESTTATTLWSSGGGTSTGTANQFSGSALGTGNLALVSVAGAGDYADVQGKFEYKIKDSDTIYTLGGKKYVELGVFATDVNDQVVDSKITISNIGSNKGSAVATSFANSKPAFVTAIENEKDLKIGAIAESLANVDTSGKAEGNQQILQESLKGFDASLLAGGSDSLFNSGGINSSANISSDVSTSLANFDFSSLLAVLNGGSLGGDFKIDASINFEATISSAALGVSTSTGGSINFNSIANALTGSTSQSLTTEQWSKVNTKDASVETKKTTDWSKVQIGDMTEENYSETDYLQAVVAGATTTTNKTIDWSKVNTDEFSSETYNQMDWSKVEFGDMTTESKSTMDWSKVKIGSGANQVTTEKLSTTDELQVAIGTNTTYDYSSTDWSLVQADEFSEETYSSLDWSKVNVAGMSTESKKSLDWNKVKIGDLTSESKKTVDWSLVDINGAQSETLSTTDKLQININGNVEESYKTTDWAKVTWGEFSDETYAATDWSLVKLGDVTTETNNTLDWQKVNFGDVTTETKSTMNWKNVNVKGVSNNTTISTTDSYQVLAANGELKESNYATTDWSKVEIGEFAEETYNTTDWSLVKLDGLTTESKKATQWSKVSDGVLTNESSSSTDETQYLLANGDSTKLSKKTKWNKLQVGEFSQETYSNIDWSQVNMGNFQKVEESAIEWENVQFGEFTSKQNKQTNWSKVNFGDLTEENYSEMNWGEVNMKGAKSINYNTVDWSLVEFDEFSEKTYKKTDWNQVQFGDMTDTQYSEVNWGKVKTKGMSSETSSNINWSLVDFGDYTTKSYKQQDWSKVAIGDLTEEQTSTIDWSQKKIWKGKYAITEEQYSQMDWNSVIQGDSFSSKSAKSVNWSAVSAGQVNETSMAKLEGFGLKGKAAAGVAALKAGQTKEASFALLNDGSAGSSASQFEGSNDAVATALSGITAQKELQLV